MPNQIEAREEPVAAVLMKMLGDLTGLTLLVFSQQTALQVAGLMMRKPATTLGEIAEEPNATVDAPMGLDDAFAFLEEHDYEPVPAVDNGQLVGGLPPPGPPRALAEGAPPEPLGASTTRPAPPRGFSWRRWSARYPRPASPSATGAPRRRDWCCQASSGSPAAC